MTQQIVLATFAGLGLFLLPGLALLRLGWPARLALDERLCMAAGLSCALPPLLLLYAELAGLGWGSIACLATLALSALIACWPRRAESTDDSRPAAAPPPSRVGYRFQDGRPPPRPSPAPALLLLAITAATFVARFVAVRGWAAGGFGDSYHHTMIAQLLVDNGGLFRSWQPYAPLGTFTYHFGFHSLVAWLSWLSGYPTPLGLLAIGQAQSALAAPLAYVLATRMLGSRTAGLWAAVFAGAVSIMPGYYVNWGRYTQLAGQTILVPCVLIWAALIDAATAPAPRRGALLRLGLLAALSTGGLALTHYRVAIFAGGFVLVYALYALAARVRRPAGWLRLSIVGGLAGGLGLLLAVPWLLRASEGAITTIGGFYLNNNVGSDMGNALAPSELARALPISLWLPALIGLGLCLALRRWQALVLAGWAGLLWLAANPYLIGLNGAGLLSSFAVVIASYLALAPLAGAAPALLGELLARRPRLAPLVGPTQIGLGALVLAWGLSGQAQIADRSFELYTPADAAAMAWLRENTPPEARFFVNSFGVYENSLWAGSDGGWWIPFISGRATNLPPYLHGMEEGEQPGYQQRVAAENGALTASPIESPATAAALRAAGYSYLYDGPAANPPGEYLDPARINASPLYEQVYAREGVTIWRVR
jgi:hypothetical protein